MTITTIAVLLVVVLFGGGALGGQASQQLANVAGSGQLNVAALPPEAAEIVPLLVQAATSCPELPPARIAAHITVESGWDPHAVNSQSGAAGLVQFMPYTWINHGPGGDWPVGGRPRANHPVFDPATHLAAAVEFMCGNLHAMAVHLELTGKPITLLDAVAVCHVAGCGRVLHAPDGMPASTEIHQYVHDVNTYHARYQANGPGVPPAILPPAPMASTEPLGAACTVQDPTTDRCVTPRTLWLYQQTVTAAGGSWPYGIGCWGTRPSNPSSDHPHGRACDFTLGTIGRFPTPEQRQLGWVYAEWMRTYATALHVNYIVWDGQIWSVTRASEGWRTYAPGGAYDVTSPTGGHYDHIHVSTTS